MESQRYPELPHEFPELDDIEERAERGRMFYQRFPGTAISDEWLRHRHDMPCRTMSNPPTGDMPTNITPEAKGEEAKAVASPGERCRSAR